MGVGTVVPVALALNIITNSDLPFKRQWPTDLLSVCTKQSLESCHSQH